MARLAVCGGGHLGHALCAVLAREHRVSLLTRAPFPVGPIVARTGTDAVVGTPCCVTDDPDRALSGAQTVLLAVPAPAQAAVLAAIALRIDDACWVGVLPGTGGAAERARAALDRTSRIFLTRESPFNCRIRERGAVVDVLGVAPRLGVVALDPQDRAAACALAADLLGLEAEPLGSTLVPLLRPVNAALHPVALTRLLAMQAAAGGFEQPPDLYASWDTASSVRYLAASGDLVAIARAHGLADPAEIQPVPAHYGTDDPEALTARIRGLAGLRGLTAPCVPVGARWHLDRGSRLFAEDVFDTLGRVLRLAGAVGLPVPALQALARDLGLPPA